jgi:hypothetical protein
MEFVWANRRSPFKPWHVPGIPELDWILDYVYTHPDSVEQMSLAYNWMPYPEAPPVWFHDLLLPDGRPYRAKEIQAIRDLTGTVMPA